MKFARFCLLASAVAFAAGCSTPEGRIQKHAAMFASLPPEVQANVRAGKVEVGYSADVVRLALGEPDRRYTRTTANGTEEVWAYRDHKPTFSFGVGIGGGGGSTSMGGGVGVTTGGDRRDDKLRVVFSNAKVVGIETATK